MIQNQAQRHELARLAMVYARNRADTLAQGYGPDDAHVWECEERIRAIARDLTTKETQQ